MLWRLIAIYMCYYYDSSRVMSINYIAPQEKIVPCRVFQSVQNNVLYINLRQYYKYKINVLQYSLYISYIPTCIFTPSKEWRPYHRSHTAANGTQCLTIAIDSAPGLR